MGKCKTLNWQDLQEFKPAKPWILAGGSTSGVELSPGDKDLAKVALLFSELAGIED